MLSMIAFLILGGVIVLLEIHSFLIKMNIEEPEYEGVTPIEQQKRVLETYEPFKVISIVAIPETIAWNYEDNYKSEWDK